MKNLQSSINAIYSDADAKAVSAIIDQADAINNLLDNAHASMRICECADAMTFVASAVEAYEELLEMAENCTSFTLKGAFLDAFGIVKLNRPELPTGVEYTLKARAMKCIEEIIK